ncbi:MAG: methyl-accepting chemotaxis protein [Lachnospiraceae bacterium]|nr:methyl-accepting chemotaxis protein [Lachnospiraceae bacterium]
MLKKQSIFIKLGIMMMPLAIMAIVLGIYSGVSQISTLNQAKTVYYDELKGLIDEILSEDRDFYQAQLASERAHLLEEKGDTDGVTEELATYDENHAQVIEGIEEIDTLFKNDEYLYNDYRMSGQSESISSLVAKSRELISAWETAYDPHTKSGDYDSQYPAFMAAREDIASLQDIVEEYATYKNAQMAAEIRNEVIVLMILIIALIAVLLVLGIFIMRYILGSTKVISHSLSKLSNGEFDKISEYLDYEDEIGGMIKDTNTLIDALQAIISDVKNTTETLGVSSNDLADTAGQISHTADDVSNAIQEIAKGATEQADSIQQATESVGNIDVAVTGVTENSEMLADTAGEMNSASQTSADELDKLMKSSEEMNRNVEEITEAINTTSHAVNTVNEKVDMITNIASQTNLLALNASIEAARAGDAGRGFAVVATEIGSLATDSNNTAEEIRKEMASLLEQSEQATQKADAVKKVALEQQKVMQATVDSIHDLIANIETTVSGVGSISSNADTCMSAKDIVVDAMGSLSAISEENAAASQQTSASMQELNATVNVLAASADKLNDLARKLGEDMSFFK